MRVVVTGGAGFIGAHTCGALVAGGHEVVAFDDLSTGRSENLQGTGASLVVGTILEPENLDAVFTDADAVVHLAARSSVPRSFDEPRATVDVNVAGTVHVLDAVVRAGRGAHVVVASSSTVYGSNPALPKHEGLEPRPMNPYGISKLAAEAAAFASEADVLVFRFFNVFGPMQTATTTYASVVPAFIDAALRDAPLPVHGDGRQTRDFTYVGAVATAVADAVGRRVVDERPVNLAFGSRVSVLELADAIGAVLGRQLKLDFRSGRCGDMRDTQADTRRFSALFPDADPVDLKEGLQATIDWFRSNL